MDRQTTKTPMTETTSATNASAHAPAQLHSSGAAVPVKTAERDDGLLSSIIVPRASSTREIAALETAMQGLALDSRHPVALELAATATSRQFLLRATTPLAQQHLADQVLARYPQASIQPVTAGDDPLVLRTGEAV